MIDLNLIRNNPELVEKNLNKRNDPVKLELFYKVKELDEFWRTKRKELDELRSKRNKISKEISERKKKGEDSSDLFTLAKQLPQKIQQLQNEEQKIHTELMNMLKRLPNILDKSVPFGKDDEDNVIVKKWGDAFLKKGMSHPDFLINLGLADFERASKASGSRAYYLFGKLVILSHSLQRYALDFYMKKGFIPVYVPFLLKKEVEEASTDLDDFKDVIYKIEDEDLYLNPTSEHAMLGYFYNEVLDVKQLPVKFVGFSTCFRKEAGSHGKDTKGIFRVHQFDKIEQFIYALPDHSWDFFEELINNAAELYQSLKIPYRIVNVCTGDIGTVAAKKYDIEGWFPIQGKYRELGSYSNCTDYQARRANIKYFDGKERKYLHTLNGTGMAVQRTIAAIVENYQDEKGLLIPEVLVPYTGFKRIDFDN